MLERLSSSNQVDTCCSHSNTRHTLRTNTERDLVGWTSPLNYWVLDFPLKLISRKLLKHLSSSILFNFQISFIFAETENSLRQRFVKKWLELISVALELLFEPRGCFASNGWDRQLINAAAEASFNSTRAKQSLFLLLRLFSRWKSVFNTFGRTWLKISFDLSAGK